MTTTSDTSEIPPQNEKGVRPDSPLELSPPDWKESLRRTLAEFKSDRGALISAGMAFYWFLAVFPSLIAAVGVLGLVEISPDNLQKITEGIRKWLPGDSGGVLAGAVDTAQNQPGGSSVVATLVGLVLALWSASAGMVAMQAGLNVAYDVGEDRKFVGQRAVALLLLVAMAVLGGLASALIVFGQPLGNALRDNLPFGGAFVLVWTLIRYGLALVAVTLLFATFYYLAPNRESPRWTWVSPGGLVGTAIWLLASLGFSFYVSAFGSYGETYGSLAGVVLLLLWLYLSALAVIFGGELNAELERQAAMRKGELPAPGETRRSRAGLRRRSRPEPAQEQQWTQPQTAPAQAQPAQAQPGASPAAPAQEPEPTPAPADNSEWARRMAELRSQWEEGRSDRS